MVVDAVFVRFNGRLLPFAPIEWDVDLPHERPEENIGRRLDGSGVDRFQDLRQLCFCVELLRARHGP
jgi:hypothetical protein